MTSSEKAAACTEGLNDAIANGMKVAQAIADYAKTTATATGEKFGSQLYQWVEQNTDKVGRFVTPIAEHPFVRLATKVPGVSWLLAALGQVDVDRVEKEVAQFQRTYPADSPEQLAQRLIAETSWKAAGIGLATNVIPPVALMLFAVDLGAISALQANLVYRIATIYGFSPTDPARRGEVLALWGLMTAGSSTIKTGLSVVELLPGLGTVIGAGGDAALLYGLGYLACQFYAEKQRIESEAKQSATTTLNVDSI